MATKSGLDFNYDDDFLSALLKGHPARGLGWSGPPISAMSAAEKKIAQQRAAAKAAGTALDHNNTDVEVAHIIKSAL